MRKIVSKKNEIIKLSLILAMIILIGLNTTVLATNQSGFSGYTLNNSTSANTSNTNEIEVVDTKSNNQNSTNDLSNTNNTTDKLANTGLEDLPWLMIVACAISAAFAYNKIKEYKSI